MSHYKLFETLGDMLRPDFFPREPLNRLPEPPDTDEPETMICRMCDTICIEHKYGMCKECYLSKKDSEGADMYDSMRDDNYSNY